jgi:long-chain fatty acid transport protein
MTWHLTNGDTVKSGIAYDESPIADAHRTARVPTNDRLWWTVGYGTNLTQNWHLDIAAGYMWMDRLHVNEREYNVQEVALYRSSLNVDYKNTALLLGAQVNYRF